MERRKFEELLGMSSGYVLDFSNRTFAEMILESTGRNIYDPRYDNASGSKANRLRAFWKLEQDALVGKLMSDMLDYCDKTGLLAQECGLIVARLLGKEPVRPAATTQAAHPPTTPAQSTGPSDAQLRSEALAKLKEEFSRLAVETDRNKAGLALEGILNRLFELFHLRPRQPFRVVGEQIDGSFELDGQVYLLESKWEKQALPEADLLIFRGKIEGKSTFTRGVFISLNGISVPAQDAITRGKAPSFFVLNGHDLIMILNEMIDLPEFLRKRIRLLAEQGRVCVTFSELI